MNRKRWLVTFDNDKKSVEGKGKWLDLKKLERIEKVKDYDEDQHSESPMDEGVVVPEGYTDYSCKYCTKGPVDLQESVPLVHAARGLRAAVPRNPRNA